jgi:hypothetical protein
MQGMGQLQIKQEQTFLLTRPRVREYACVGMCACESMRALGGGIGVERSGRKVCVKVCSRASERHTTDTRTHA